jgi:N-acetylglucosaminyl-diphospho-decaprenol L-rhamnosyltransferase
MTIGAADLASVVLTYGDEPGHGDIVRELRNQGIQPDKITVVHNPMSSGKAERHIVDGVEVLRNPKNLGYAGAVNVGLRQPRVRAAPAVGVFTDDVRLDGHAISASTIALQGNSQVGIFGMAMQDTSGAVFSLGGVSLRGGAVQHLRESRSGPSGHLVDCDWVDGAAWVFRTEVLREVGLLEERYFMYYEEALICLKAKRAGWEIATIVNARVTQSPGADKRPAAHAYLMARNSLHYAVVAGGWSNAAYGTVRLLNRAVREHARSKDRLLEPTERERHALRRTGVLRGMKAAALSHWGPPPDDLPGPSDIVGARDQ